MAFDQWSQTAATNASSDPSINWAEGQLPSTVNDSARAMMAAMAKWRDDISGALQIGGSDGTNYTLTTNTGYTAARLHNQIIAFRPIVTNTGTYVQLNVDGIGAHNIRYKPGFDGELPAGSLVAGTPYLVRYDNTDQCFYLINSGFNPYSVPVGGCIAYAGQTPPNSNFAVMQGQAISRAAYSTLYTIIGQTYGAGDGSTTYNLPDLRGRVPAGYDPSNATGRLTSALSGVAAGTLGSAGGTQNQNVSQAQLPNVGLSVSANGSASVTSTQGNIVTAAGVTQVTQAGGLLVALNSPAFVQAISSTGTASVTGSTSSINGGVAQAGLIMVQPTIVLNYLIRII